MTVNPSSGSHLQHSVHEVGNAPVYDKPDEEVADFQSNLFPLERRAVCGAFAVPPR